MLAMFSPTFVVDTSLISAYNLGAPLNLDTLFKQV